MPGIAGVITTDPRHDQAARILEAMIAPMLHEPFYTHGSYLAPDVGCYVGWVGHASVVSRNTSVDPTKRTALIFAGEHFGSPLPNARNCSELQGLNGWFSGVVIDHANAAAMLFVDRFGMHRLYYTVADGCFFFASEAKSILAVRPECRTLDAQALGQFVAFGSVFGNRTLFKGISLIPGGSAWTFEHSVAPKKVAYFDISDWERQPVLPHDEYMRRLKDTLIDVVPKYCTGPEAVAVSLTGGLDTRIIMAAAPSERVGLQCYTYAGPYRECFDVRVASQVAERCGLPFTPIPLGPDFFTEFDSLASRAVWLTDGSLDICGAHELYFSQRARAIAPIRLTGNYGSEVLRGTSTFKPDAAGGALAVGDLRPHIEQARVAHAELQSRHDVAFAVSAEIPWHLYGRFAAAQSQLTLRSPYMDNALVALAFQAPADLRRPGPAWLRLIEDLKPSLSSITTDMGWKAAESSVRSLPRRLQRYALFKAEWYYNLGMPGWLSHIDRPILRALEPSFLGTHKIDHYRIWFRDQLADYVRSMVSSAATSGRPHVNRAWCEAFVNSDRISGQQALDVSKLITLELIHGRLLGSDVAGTVRSAAPLLVAAS